jgi:hypothetical protein
MEMTRKEERRGEERREEKRRHCQSGERDRTYRGKGRC